MSLKVNKKTYRTLFLIAAFFAAAGQGLPQDANNADEIQAGHKVAVLVCANCHVAASDQASKPILRPPAPSFASIMQRKDVTADWLRNFMKTTHRSIENPNGMPNPLLLDYQVEQITAYLLSLRKAP